MRHGTTFRQHETARFCFGRTATEESVKFQVIDLQGQSWGNRQILHEKDDYPRMGPALRMASLKAIEPAMRNAFSFESTSWYEPKVSRTFTSTTG